MQEALRPHRRHELQEFLRSLTLPARPNCCLGLLITSIHQLENAICEKLVSDSCCCPARWSCWPPDVGRRDPRSFPRRGPFPTRENLLQARPLRSCPKTSNPAQSWRSTEPPMRRD